MINRCSKQQFWVKKIFIGIIGIIFFLVSCNLTDATTDVGCSGDSAPLTITTAAGGKTFESIIISGKVPADLAGYDERSREIFSLYDADAPIVAKYVKVGGTGDGSSFIDAAGDPKAVVDGITVSANNVYVVLLSGGTYTPDEMGMKNHVAIVGGVDGCLGSSAKATILDGEGSRRIFVNTDLDKSALLYGVTIINGYSAENGGGIYNDNSSPSLTQVTFSSNTATYAGGAMYNENSSPNLIGATFSGNIARFGGAMYNSNSSPVLIGVTFSGNTANRDGGGIYNRGGASPIMIGVTFSGNIATDNGGGMYHYNGGGDGSLIINGIFWGNQSVSDEGPNFYFNNEGSVSGNLGIYNSTIQWGTKDTKGDIVNGATYTSNFFSAGFAIEGGTAPVTISFSNISDTDPQLAALADNGGSVLTHAIPEGSWAVDKGLYVKREGDNYYYSEDKTDWHTEPDLSEKGDPPTDAEDLTATDAIGVTRVGRPDHGAYEYGASQ